MKEELGRGDFTTGSCFLILSEVFSSYTLDHLEWWSVYELLSRGKDAVEGNDDTSQ